NIHITGKAMAKTVERNGSLCNSLTCQSSNCYRGGIQSSHSRRSQAVIHDDSIRIRKGYGPGPSGHRQNSNNKNSAPTKHTCIKSSGKVMSHGTAFASGSVCVTGTANGN